MMAKSWVDVDVKGLRKLNRTFKRLDDRMRASALGDALEDAARPIRDDARTRGSYVWNELAAGIHIYPGEEAPDHASVIIAEHKDLYQAWWFEFGTGERRREGGGYTGRMQATPFLRPALHTQASQAVRTFKRSLKRTIRKVV